MSEDAVEIMLSCPYDAMIDREAVSADPAIALSKDCDRGLWSSHDSSVVVLSLSLGVMLSSMSCGGSGSVQDPSSHDP